MLPNFCSGGKPPRDSANAKFKRQNEAGPEIVHFASYIVLVADYLHEHSFTAAAVELSVENLLPRAEV